MGVGIFFSVVMICLFCASKASSMDTTMTVRNILCYGDSLSAGYYRHGTEFHPYGNTIAARSGLYVRTVGMSGWTSSQMVDAAEKAGVNDLIHSPGDGLVVLLKQRKWDLVCLMAGTNDLGYGMSTGDIVENMEILIQHCLRSNPFLKVALLTVPQTGAETKHEMTRKRRAAVDNGLVRLANKYNNRVFLIDTSIALPNPGSDLDSADRELWDEDMLHFSPRGSERLGEYVYTVLVEKGLITSKVPNTA